MAQAVLRAMILALVRSRLAVGAVACLVVVLGAVVAGQMPLQLLPEIRYTQIRIIGDIPGQTSRVIEENVNEPLEAELESIQGLVQLQSRAGDGRAYVDLYFESGHDLDRALREVTQAAERARGQMPANIPPPRIFEVTTMEDPVMQFAFGSDELTAQEIRRRLRAGLLPRLRAVPGVEAVYIGREEVPEIVVDVDPVRQVSVGVSLQALEATLLEATDPPVSGTMRSGAFEGLGLIGDEAWDARRLQGHWLTFDDDSTAVPLELIASVHRGPSQDRLRTRLDGQPAVLVSIHRSPRAHALRMARDVRQTVEQFADDEGEGSLSATLLFDDSLVTRSAVSSVIVAAIGGALLAMALLAIVLRQRRQVVLVAAVVGVSLSAALAVLHSLGMTLNLLTLAGLLLSVGLGLDYAIIYLDRLDRLSTRESAGSGDAHVDALVEVAGPLFGALLTTLAAVLPFLIVSGLVAELFEPLIWTVAICAVTSFVSAIVLLPVFASQDRVSGSTAQPRAAPSRIWPRLQQPLVAWPVAVALGAVLLLGGRALPFEVLPTVDDGFVGLRIAHPAGIPADAMDRIARDVERTLAAIDGTGAVFTTVGGYFREGLPAFRPATANFMIRVDHDRAGSSADWASAAREAIGGLDLPELSVSTTLPRIRGVQTRLTDADMVVVLTREDGDLLELAETESQVVRTLESVPGLVDVERVRGGVSPRWVVEPRHERLSALAIDQATVRQAVDLGLDGKVLRQRMQGGEPLALRLRYDRRFAGSPQDLESLRLPVEGSDVHLGDVADFSFTEEPTHIERREGQRVVRVSTQLDPGGPGPLAVARKAEQALSGAGLPQDVAWWLEGEIDALVETRRTFAIAIGLALLTVLTLLVVQYGSLALALAGLVTIPLSGAGTVALLAMLGRPLDAIVLAGLLIAVGIVANNVILVLSQARGAYIEGATPSLSQALQRAARERFRPIMLTVLSTVLGVSPLLWGGVEVFGMLQPLAIAVSGALLLSVPLACLVLPAIAASLARLTAGQAGGLEVSRAGGLGGLTSSRDDQA